MSDVDDVRDTPGATGAGTPKVVENFLLALNVLLQEHDVQLTSDHPVPFKVGGHDWMSGEPQAWAELGVRLLTDEEFAHTGDTFGLVGG